MGYGDYIMSSGTAKGAAARGELIAFGDGATISWNNHAREIFKGNPNVAAPGQERDPRVRWVKDYKGARPYNSVSPKGDRWVWNMDFRPTPGEIFFDEAELEFAGKLQSGFVLIEPNLPPQKRSSFNKTWPPERYQVVADRLRAEGRRVLQLQYPGARYALRNVEMIKTATFREALAVLSRASLFIGSEGGLHHASAALGIKAVVLFGAWIPASVTGYDSHANLASGGPACGKLHPCQHCREAMRAIMIEHVYQAAKKLLVRAEAERAGAI